MTLLCARYKQLVASSRAVISVPEAEVARPSPPRLPGPQLRLGSRAGDGHMARLPGTWPGRCILCAVHFCVDGAQRDANTAGDHISRNGQGLF